MVEIIIVISIIGILSAFGADTFLRIKAENEYDQDVQTLYEIIKTARNRAFVTEARDSDPNNRSQLVQIVLNNGFQVQGVENVPEALPATDNPEIQDGNDVVWASYQSHNRIKVNLIEQSENAGYTQSTTLDAVCLYFTPEPHAEMKVKYVTKATGNSINNACENGTNEQTDFVSAKMILGYRGESTTLTKVKLLELNTISQNAELNDFPIITKASKVNNTTIRLFTNTSLDESIADTNTHILSDHTTFQVQNGTNLASILIQNATLSPTLPHYIDLNFTNTIALPLKITFQNDGTMKYNYGTNLLNAGTLRSAVLNIR